jgi:acetyl/propionyl-CoA carboxylase alpha subunit
MPAIISAAEVTDAEAIHPDMVSERNADFAERVSSGFKFIGPSPESIPASW